MPTASIQELLQEITRDPRQFPAFATVLSHTQDSSGGKTLECELQPTGIVVELRPTHSAIHASGGVYNPYKEGSTVLAVFIDGDINRGIAIGGVANGSQKVPDGVYGEHILIKDEELDLEAGKTRIHNGGSHQAVVTQDILDEISNVIAFIKDVNQALLTATPTSVGVPVTPITSPAMAQALLFDTQIGLGSYKTTILEAE